jgi:hypothetical protein
MSRTSRRRPDRHVVLRAIDHPAESFLIDVGYLEETPGHSAGFGEYVAVAWFATSVSILASALGSRFEDEESVRQAAYGLRERRRRR